MFRAEEKSKHILCSIKLFPENRAVYRVMWKNVRARQATDNNIIRYMLSAYWINNATDNTVRICNTQTFHGKSGYGHVSVYYLYTYISCHVRFKNP
jgi:hypothetical protein